MRLWSLHPKYLDAKGLVALWREGLLAQQVLLGKTKGYRFHPQLARFEEFSDPVRAITLYLRHVREEAVERNYNFNRGKILAHGSRKRVILDVPKLQIDYEFAFLKEKVRIRDRAKWRELDKVRSIEPHPIFQIIPGGIASWEKI